MKNWLVIILIIIFCSACFAAGFAETDPKAGAVNGIMKCDGDRGFSAADPNTDYTPAFMPAMLKCDQQQRMTLTASSWNTVFDINDGPMIVTNLWIAVAITTKGRLTPIKITFDEAASAQIEGFTGELFGGGFDADLNHRGNWLGVSENSPNQFSGYMRLPMPYYDSIKVEVQNTYGSNGTCWSMLERIPCTNDRLLALGIQPGMYLNTYGYGQDGSKAHYTETDLLDTNEPTILAGLFHFFNSSSYGSSNYYLEGDYRIYYGGEGTASYRSSGTEDFYHSSWYFSEGYFFYAPGDEAFTALTSTYNRACYRIFPLPFAPYDPNGIKLSWCNGESESGLDPNNTYIRWIVWSYE